VVLGALLRLDLFPAQLDLFLAQSRQVQRCIEIAGGKNMGVTTNQLAGDAVDHAVEFEAPFFPGQLAVIDHLEQQVAQLTLQVLEVAALDGVGDFVSLLQGVGDNRRVGLLDVPGTAVLRVAQTGHEVEQVLKAVHQ